MARKQSGGFNKFLNIIGLVDDEEPRESYGEEYNSGNYGRPSAYVPPRQGGRTAMPNNGRGGSQRQPQRKVLPEQAGRSNGPKRTTYGGEDNYRNDRYDDFDRSGDDRGAYTRDGARTRGNSRYEDEPRSRGNSRFEDEPRSRAGSRFEEEPRSRSRFEEEPQRRPAENRPQRAPRASQRSRTVMTSLHTLEECCDVIDELIAGNTILLTMDELDGRLMQRAVDTLSGAVFALHAAIRKASDKTYLITPASVEVDQNYDFDRRF